MKTSNLSTLYLLLAFASWAGAGCLLVQVICMQRHFADTMDGAILHLGFQVHIDHLLIWVPILGLVGMLLMHASNKKADDENEDK